MPRDHEKTKALKTLAEAQRAETEASRKVERWIGSLQREARSGRPFSEASIGGLSQANDALNKAEAIAGAAIIEFANTWLE